MGRAKNVLSAARAATPRDARVGDVRLGELRVLHHDHHGGLSRSISRRWPPPTCRRAKRHACSRARPRSRWPSRDPRAGAGRARRLCARQEAAARPLHGDRLHAAGCLALVHRGDWLLAAVLFVIGNIGFTASLTSTTRFCRTSRATTRSTACRPPATRSGISAAGCCSRSTWRGFSRQRRSALRDAGAGLAPLVSQRRRLVAAVLDSAVQARARAANGPGAAPLDCRADRRRSPGCCIRSRELRRYRNAFLMLVAFVIYNDGIGTIHRLATSYGTELGLDQGALITAILLVQFAGIPFAFLFGILAGRIGAKTSIFIALAVYVVLTIMGVPHEDRARLLRARVDGRNGAGRHPGAQPIAVCQHDSRRHGRPSSSASSRSSKNSGRSSDRRRSRWRAGPRGRAGPLRCR